MAENDKKWNETYERFAEKTRTFFSESREKTVQSLDEALEKARDYFEKAGELTQEESHQFKEYLTRDLEETGKDFTRWSTWVKEHSSASRVSAGFLDLTAQIAEGGQGLLERLSSWANSTGVYHTGEMAAPGILRCRSCEEEIHFHGAGRIPPCPKCHKTEYRRVG
ncbi:zinc ribbon-containing protein [Marinobacteraceae bacterium S3BR75-40.1]